MTEMSASRSAAGVTIFEGRIHVSGGHDGLQIFNTVSETPLNDPEFISSNVCDSTGVNMSKGYNLLSFS